MRMKNVKKRVLFFLMCAVLTLSMTLPGFPQTVLAAEGFAGGDGTEWNPYIIKTAEQLDAVRNDLNAYYKLADDIDLTEYLSNSGAGYKKWGASGWEPIGNYDSRFTGSFDGAGYKITGLWINRGNTYTDYVGLFGYIGSATNFLTTYGRVSNLGVEESVSGINGYRYVGGVAGYNDGTITNCYNTGAVSGERYVGGIAGYNNLVTIENCYNTGAVSGESYVGGVAGCNNSGTITNCYNTGAVTGTGYVGGVVGINYSTITNCCNTGTVTGDSNFVGGVAGSNYGGTITNCYYNTDNYPDPGVAVGGGSGTANNVKGLTTAQMTADNVLSGAMSGLGSAWRKRVETDDFFYYPELSVFYAANPVTKREIDSEISARAPRKALTGTATISNMNPRIGDTLIGSLVGGNNTGTLSYVWKVNGVQVGTGASYTVTTENRNRTITLEITSSVRTGTVISTGTAAVLKKAAPSPPPAPTLASKTYYSITLTANDLYEFSKDGTNWQANNVFGGLTASTAYTFYQRIAETTDTLPSAASAAMSVTTDAPPALTGTATISNMYPRIGNILTGSLVSGNNTGTLSYVWKADSVQVGTGASYTVATTDLGKEITLEITSNAEPGMVMSTATAAVLKKLPPSPPPAPTLASKTYYSITLTANDLYEFSKDGTNWQTSSVFDGLAENTAYTFYQRIAETTDREPSAASAFFKETTAPEPIAEGTGTQSDPYLIKTAGQLDKVRNNLTAYYRLTDDIDLTQYLASGGTGYGKWGTSGWQPIGTNSSQFTGSFDGAGYTITGLWIDRSTTNYVGLFGYIGAGGSVSDLGVEESAAGIKGAQYVGGVAGFNGGTIQNCCNTGAVRGTNNVGGVAGRNEGIIQNCYNTGAVNGTGGSVGGVAGYNSGTIQSCYNTGAVSGTGSNYAGGVAGSNIGTIQNCYNTGTVSGAAAYLTGGVAGYNSGTITNCYYNTGNYTGKAIGSGTGSNVVGLTAEQMTADNVLTESGDMSGLGNDAWAKRDRDNDFCYYPELLVFYNVNPATEREIASMESVRVPRVDVISVTVEWGAMEFTYSEGEWNAATHVYDGAGWSCVEDANRIKVTNNSTQSVSASFDYKRVSGYGDIDGAFEDENGAELSDPVTLPDGSETPQSVEVYLQLTGLLPADPNKVIIGTVTVTVEEVPSP